MDRETIELIDKGSEAVAPAKKDKVVGGVGRVGSRWRKSREEEEAGVYRVLYVLYRIAYGAS